MYKLLFATILLCLGISAGSAYNLIAFYSPTIDQGVMSFIEEANKWFPSNGAVNGFTYKFTTDWNELNQDNLKNYQVVIFLNAIPPYAVQRQAFNDYIENGGGWLGFHDSASNNGDPSSWPWYYNTFLGSGGQSGVTRMATAIKYHNEAPNHRAMSGLNTTFQSSKSEWYAFQTDLTTNADIDILASCDQSSFPVGNSGKNIWRSGYFPILWTNKRYKMIYANFGVNLVDTGNWTPLSSTFDSNDQNRFIYNSLNYLTGH